jgi:hypothetical protein
VALPHAARDAPIRCRANLPACSLNGGYLRIRDV